MQNAYLVFDIGTGNTRVALVGEDGAILDIAKENTRMYTDPIASRAQYFKPHEWQDAVFSLIRKLLAAHPDVTVRAVTGSTLRQGIVLVGHDGESIVGYTNADRRGEGFMQELDWKRIWELTDLSPSPIFSAIKILGTSKLQPQVLEQTKFYTSISDWMGYVFTGRAVWERAQAMQSALYDAVNGCWSQELCDLIGVDIGKLPELADAGTVLGPIRPEICQALGLTGEPVFVVGTADTPVGHFRHAGGGRGACDRLRHNVSDAQNHHRLLQIPQNLGQPHGRARKTYAGGQHGKLRHQSPALQGYHAEGYAL